MAKKISLKSLGIDVRGRSHVLKINYRTTQQIRMFADKLLDPLGDDLDDGSEDRSATRSLLRGPMPETHGFSKQELQIEFIVQKILELKREGVSPEEIAIFARKSDLLTPIESALTAKNIQATRLSSDQEREKHRGIRLGTMHRAKGLEFKIVFVSDASDQILPLAFALKNISDPIDVQDHIEREKQLLYVSVTRARDQAFISWVGAPSKFLSLSNTLV